jgi:hypothetical protein
VSEGVSVKNGPLFSFLIDIPIRFGIQKLVQERSAFARKRNAMRFLTGARDLRWRRAFMLRSIID